MFGSESLIVSRSVLIEPQKYKQTDPLLMYVHPKSNDDVLKYTSQDLLPIWIHLLVYDIVQKRKWNNDVNNHT